MSVDVHDVICYVALTLGIPGNILSAIVWLRGHVVSKNSSSVYLAALAIVDLIGPLFNLILNKYKCFDGWFCVSCWSMTDAAALLEPLLVLSFSVERLIVIRHPFQVCYTRTRWAKTTGPFLKFTTFVSQDAEKCSICQNFQFFISCKSGILKIAIFFCKSLGKLPHWK